jgi:uncharacterized Tic20 family protein
LFWAIKGRIQGQIQERNIMPEDPSAPPTIQPPPPPPPPPPVGAPPPGNPESQARTWNMLCHLSALAGFVFPLGNILGPLLVWQIKKNEFPSVDVHGKAALNFQITVAIAMFVTGLVAGVLSFFCVGYLLIPLVLLIVLGGMILAIIAGIKANNGEDYQYPWSLDLVK